MGGGSRHRDSRLPRPEPHSAGTQRCWPWVPCLCPGWASVQTSVGARSGRLQQGPFLDPRPRPEHPGTLSRLLLGKGGASQGLILVRVGPATFPPWTPEAQPWGSDSASPPRARPTQGVPPPPQGPARALLEGEGSTDPGQPPWEGKAGGPDSPLACLSREAAANHAGSLQAPDAWGDYPSSPPQLPGVEEETEVLRGQTKEHGLVGSPGPRLRRAGPHPTPLASRYPGAAAGPSLRRVLGAEPPAELTPPAPHGLCAPGTLTAL